MSAPAIASPLDLAKGFAPELRSRSDEIEQHRTLPRDLVDSLTDAGLFRFWVPAEYGGAQVSVATGLDTFIEIARHDAATGWCTFIANTTALLAAFMEPEQARVRLRPAGRDHGRLRPADGARPGRRRWAAGDRALAVGLGDPALHDGRRRCARRRRRRCAGGAPRRATRCVRVLRSVRRRVPRHVARRRSAGNRLVRLRGQRRIRARRAGGPTWATASGASTPRCTASRSTACSRPASRARRSGSPTAPSRSSRRSPP